MTITTDTFKDKFIAWLQLIRFDKPVGTDLLLYPTLWALFLANASIERLPSVVHVIIFTLGAFIMRAAGCAINDFADRRVDAQVKRTKNRPLADGRLTAKTAVLTFVGLSGLSACLLFFLPVQVFYWSLIALALAFIYPFTKRHTHLPQVVLAMAFGWAVPMAFVAVNSEHGQGGGGVVGWLICAGRWRMIRCTPCATVMMMLKLELSLPPFYLSGGLAIRMFILSWHYMVYFWSS